MQNLNVKFTNDHSIFQTIEGNRPLDMAKVQKLEQSMMCEQLIIPIIVNEKYEVIDGQHRLESCKRLGRAVPYLVMEGYGMDQVKRANLVATTWTKEDFLNLHVNSKTESYVKFNELFINRKMNITDLIKIFALAQNKSFPVIMTEFDDGDFTLDNLDKVEEILSIVDLFGEFDGVKQQSFISALLKLVARPTFKKSNLKNKLLTRMGQLNGSYGSNYHEYLNILCNRIYSFGATKNPIFYDINTSRFYS